jgi:hypothetical protein
MDIMRKINAVVSFGDYLAHLYADAADLEGIDLLLDVLETYEADLRRVAANRSGDAEHFAMVTITSALAVSLLHDLFTDHADLLTDWYPRRYVENTAQLIANLLSEIIQDFGSSIQEMAGYLPLPDLSKYREEIVKRCPNVDQRLLEPLAK